ncbi:tripartite tricarboxylate transporter TctB family protein [Domibacillus enclensis]|uniref:Putative tricarboxylic transport membrane protein n=1 Tax=Domibacillus enclensis TaxID=1017273 RepID=A0A1N7BAZ7_9BACI|nr:tripartite tricarboxylate transporter TctB family protein [Domibacillus enclensis]OXS74660.1 transporter [Domibacillus enclensis]SIR48561.1 putative tricarboxylic transport membrane protein [Domibacillus enclensis]
MNKTFDRYASIVFLLIGVLFIVESRKISASSYGSNVGPDIFPIGLGILLVLLSIKLFIETAKMKKEDTKGEKPDYKRFLIIFGAAVLYVVLLEPLGYVITTFLFLAVGFQVLEKGGWLKTIAIAAAFSFGVYYLFVMVLQGSLPGFPI